MSPAASSNRQPHRAQADRLAAVLFPSLDAVDKPRVGLPHQMIPEPLQVHPARVVSTLRLVLDVPRLSLPPQQPTDRRFTHPEERCRCCVRTALLRPVRLDQSPPQIDRKIRHDLSLITADRSRQFESGLGRGGFAGAGPLALTLSPLRGARGSDLNGRREDLSGARGSEPARSGEARRRPLPDDVRDDPQARDQRRLVALPPQILRRPRSRIRIRARSRGRGRFYFLKP
jgi:hypothetical protein